MEKLLLTFMFIAGIASAASAQSLRLGEPIPDIDIISAMGPELKQMRREFVCLVFVHPDSKPCIEALTKFQEVDNALANDMSVVLITYTGQKNRAIMQPFVDRNTTVAFDNKQHTFRNFGIEHVPFSVIYCHKHRRTLWFGTLNQLDRATAEEVIKNHKHL